MEQRLLSSLRKVTLNCFAYQAGYLGELLYKEPLIFNYNHDLGRLRCIHSEHMENLLLKSMGMEIETGADSLTVFYFLRNNYERICYDVVGSEFPYSRLTFTRGGKMNLTVNVYDS